MKKKKPATAKRQGKAQPPKDKTARRGKNRPQPTASAESPQVDSATVPNSRFETSSPSWGRDLPKGTWRG